MSQAVAQEFTLNNVRCSPQHVAHASTLDELRDELRAAAKARRQVKAVGNGWSFSNAAVTSGVVIPTTRHLKRVLDIAPGELRAGVDGGALLRFEAGATVDELNAHLKSRGQALMNQPGFGGLTWVGTASMGGHGSGMWTGALSSHIAALHILTVDENWEVVELQIEPSNGISNPATFSSLRAGVRLVQDDELFQASVCGLGCLGIIYSATIHVQPHFFLKETRRRVLWDDIKPRLGALLAEQGRDKRLHSIEVWLSPYRVKGKLWAMLGEREWCEGPARGRRGIGVTLGGSKVLLTPTLWWFSAFPSTVPGGLFSAMNMAGATDVVMPAEAALNFGNLNNAPMIATNAGIDVTKATDVLSEGCDWFEQRLQSGAGFVTSPLGIRFIGASQAWLSPAFQRDSCQVEVPTLRGTPKRVETQREFQRFLMERGARPHWGCVNHVAPELLPTLFPALGDWLQVYRRLNPVGFFDNALTDTMGFRERLNGKV